MGGGRDEDESRAASPRASLKTINNYSNWKQKLREACRRRIHDDRTRLLWRMRSLPNNNNNININHSSSSSSSSSSSLTHQESTFIQSALQGIVSDELTKINVDLLWEYDGLCSQPECEDILLEMQNIFYQDLELHQTTQQISWEDDDDEYLARLVYQHMQLSDGTVQKTVWCPICKQGELQENHSHVYCTACEIRLLRGEEVTLELIRNRLAEVHEEHLDRGCKLRPKICKEIGRLILEIYGSAPPTIPMKLLPEHHPSTSLKPLLLDGFPS